MYQGKHINKNIGINFRIFLYIICCVLVIISGFMISCKSQTINSQETVTVTKGTISQVINSTGYVDSSDIRNFMLPSSGKVLKSVEKGDTLQKGDIILEVDNSKAKLLISQAEENVKIAESSLRMAEINYQGALDANHVANQLAKENNNLAAQSTENALQNKENASNVASVSIEAAEISLQNTQSQADLSVQNALKVLEDAQNSYNASISQAKTALDQANNQLDVAKTTSGLTDVQLAQYEAAAANAKAAYNAAVASATAVYDNAVNTYNNALLAANNSVKAAVVAVDQAQANARLNSETAEGAYKQALISQSITYWNTLSSIEQAEKQIRATLESINTAKSQVNVAKISLENAKLELDNFTIKMPFDGMIKDINFNEGEYLSPGMIVTTVMKSDFEIVANIEESDISQVKESQEVEITLDAYPEEIIKGKISEVSPISNNIAGVVSFPITIKVENDKKDLLLYGLSANLTIITSKSENVLIVPAISVFEENDKSYVFVVNQDKKPAYEKREVITGISDFENIEIKSGLKEGDIIFLTKPTNETR